MIDVKNAPIEDIITVMFDDEIFHLTNPDNVKKENIDKKKANLAGWVMIGGYVNGKIASLFAVKDSILHFWVLKPFRKYARKLLELSFTKYPFTVFCEIPVIYKQVINFALKSGFKKYCLSENQFLKNGAFHSVQRMVRYG